MPRAGAGGRVRQRRHAVDREADTDPARLHDPPAGRAGRRRPVPRRSPAVQGRRSTTTSTGSARRWSSTTRRRRRPGRSCRRAVSDAFVGMSVEDYARRGAGWFADASHPTLGRPYLSCGFTPMIELLRYLEANGFTTHIASGGDRDFMRPFAEGLYGIPPERVIGSAIGLDFDEAADVTGLLYKSKIEFFDDGPRSRCGSGAGSADGRSWPCGNSNGDVQMLRFARTEHRPGLRLLVLHDDADREFDYTEGAEDALARGRRPRLDGRSPSRGLGSRLPRPLTVWRQPDWQDERMRLAVATPGRPLQSAPPTSWLTSSGTKRSWSSRSTSWTRWYGTSWGSRRSTSPITTSPAGPPMTARVPFRHPRSRRPGCRHGGVPPAVRRGHSEGPRGPATSRRRGPGGVLRTRSMGCPPPWGRGDLPAPRDLLAILPLGHPGGADDTGGHRGRHDRERRPPPRDHPARPAPSRERHAAGAQRVRRRDHRHERGARHRRRDTTARSSTSRTPTPVRSRPCRTGSR